MSVSLKLNHWITHKEVFKQQEIMKYFPVFARVKHNSGEMHRDENSTQK